MNLMQSNEAHVAESWLISTSKQGCGGEQNSKVPVQGHTLGETEA